MNRRYLPLDKCASGGPLRECWDLAQTIFFAITGDQAIRLTGDFPDIAPRARTRVMNQERVGITPAKPGRNAAPPFRLTCFSFLGQRRRPMCIRDI